MLGLIDKCGKKFGKTIFDPEAHAALFCEVAKDCAVLLKNDGCLPLRGDERLLAVGEFFERMCFQGAGSSLVNPPSVVTPRDAFEARGIACAYRRGYRQFDDAPDKALAADAVAAAWDADTVLLFGGLTDFEESEGFDRKAIRLADNQSSLLEALIETGKKVILILYGGSPVELPFFDRLEGLLYLCLPGMRGGEATAALLYGEVTPSGKLADSWPLSAADASCAADFGISAVSRYYESIYAGYRAYETAATPLRFPFGYGLSYTSFAYDGMTAAEEDGTLVVSADIANTGARAGAEVVQLYTQGPQSGVFRPAWELRAFTKVFCSRAKRVG